MPDGLFEFIALFLAAFAAGLVDAIAGGGGLITVPALLLAGMQPSFALGTNKLQSSFGSFTAAYRYIRAGEADIKTLGNGILFTLLGATMGTLLVQELSSKALSAIIPFLLLSVLIFILCFPKIGKEDVKPRMNELLFYILFGLGIGFYDGFFGPGTGSIWVIVFMLLLGHNMKKATAHTKVMNFTSNVVALVWFAIGGNIVYTAGLVMAVGQTLGAALGAGLVIKRGVSFIRPIFVTMVLLATVKLFYDYFFKNG